MCGPDDRFFSGAQRCYAILEPSACDAFRACEETVLRWMCSVYGCTVYRLRKEGMEEQFNMRSMSPSRGLVIGSRNRTLLSVSLH